MENHEVLWPDLPGGRRKRLDVDVRRYAPQSSGIERGFGVTRGCDAQSNSFELEGHCKNQVWHQHCHLEWKELIQIQSERPKRFVAISGTRVCTNQDRGGDKVRDVPVN